MTTFCAICDKPIRGKMAMVRMDIGKSPIRDDDPRTVDLGWWEVGPTCARKIRVELSQFVLRAAER